MCDTPEKLGISASRLRLGLIGFESRAYDQVFDVSELGWSGHLYDWTDIERYDAIWLFFPPEKRSLWNHFWFFRIDLGSGKYVWIPYWFVALVFAPRPALWLANIIHWIRTRLRGGICPACGYDLTGNTSGVCPECGLALRRDAPSVPEERTSHG